MFLLSNFMMCGAKADLLHGIECVENSDDDSDTYSDHYSGILSSLRIYSNSYWPNSRMKRRSRMHMPLHMHFVNSKINHQSLLKTLFSGTPYAADGYTANTIGYIIYEAEWLAKSINKPKCTKLNDQTRRKTDWTDMSTKLTDEPIVHYAPPPRDVNWLKAVTTKALATIWRLEQRHHSATHPTSQQIALTDNISWQRNINNAVNNKKHPPLWSIEKNPNAFMWIVI